MKSKYSQVISDAIDKYWGQFHCAPTIRDIQLAIYPVRLNSTSVVRRIIHHLPGVTINVHRRPTPDWVNQAIKEAYEKKTKVPVSG